MKKILTSCALLLVLVIGQACTSATAEPKPKVPRSIAMTELVAGTVDTLRLRATWQASTVGTANSPITYPVTWVRSGVTLRSVTKTGLADTISIVRAPIGRADTVTFSVRSLYTANGNLSAWASMTRFYLNADLQFPTIPVIVTIDTL